MSHLCPQHKRIAQPWLLAGLIAGTFSLAGLLHFGDGPDGAVVRFSKTEQLNAVDAVRMDATRTDAERNEPAAVAK